MQQALAVLPWSWLWVCHQAQHPLPTTSQGDRLGRSGVTPFSDLFRVLGDSQERRYGAISSCHGGELMDASVSPSPIPFALSEHLSLAFLLQGELGEMGLDGIDGEEVSHFNNFSRYKEILWLSI